MLSRAFAAIGAFCATIAAAQPGIAGPALLFEASNGKVLYSEDADSQWHPASLTKIMTAYLAFEALKSGKLKLEDKIACSLVANLQPPSKVGLPVGGELTVDLALQAIIIKSANDVTVMLAEAIAGSEAAFVQKMNEASAKLGMTRTHFVNTNGLPDPAQVSTARDLAKLSRAVVANFPEYAHYWTLTDMRIGKKRLGSHNALLKSFPGADGLKTGFTCDSGFNVVASASREGRRLMAVVLGESSGNERAVRAASLLEHGFQSYGWKQLFNTESIDDMPLDPNAHAVMTVRQTVTAWNCGNRRRIPAALRKKSRDKAAPRLKSTVIEKDVGPTAVSTASTAGATPAADAPAPAANSAPRAAPAPASVAPSAPRFPPPPRAAFVEP